MYGIPSHLDLSAFVGATAYMVCMSHAQLQINFEPHGHLNIEGRWELLDGSGQLVGGRAREDANRPSGAELLIGRKVIASAVLAPEWFELHFDGGTLLRVYDDSEQNESFSIQPGDI